MGQALAERRKDRHAYTLQVWEDRINQFADDDQVKSLRGEIGIARVTLEQILNKCTTGNELMIHSQRISNLVITIKTLVESCFRLEEKTGFLLDKTKIINIAHSIADIISEEIEDPDRIKQISLKIVSTLINAAHKS